jgi:hypothetical protein
MRKNISSASMVLVKVTIPTTPVIEMDEGDTSRSGWSSMVSSTVTVCVSAGLLRFSTVI